MDKTESNKKATTKLRGHDKKQLAGKARYSRAEQDAQQKYEKSMKMHGSPSSATEYTLPCSSHLKDGNDPERKRIQEKDTGHRADARKQSHTSGSFSMKADSPKESVKAGTRNSSNVRQVHISQYETTDKGYAYHGNMQEAQKEYVLHLKSHGQGMDPAKEDASKRYVKYMASGEVPVEKDANHHTKQEDPIDSNDTKRSGSQRATSGVPSQYEKMDKGYG